MLLADGERLECVIRGRSLAVACGDVARVVRTAPGHGVIESIGERTTLFHRADAFRTKLLAANVTQVVAVVAVEPAWSADLLDRWIVAAESNHCRVAIVLNKVDLAGVEASEAALAPLRAIGYPIVRVSAKRDVSPLRPHLAGQHSVLVGQSGMGKSTLINALVPDARARVAEISTSLDTGRHTTASTILYPLADGAWIVDSPGMQEFGLAHLQRDALEGGFRELVPLLGHCRFRDCSHTHEPGCAVIDAVRAGRVDPRRLESLRRLLAEHASLRKRGAGKSFGRP